MTTTNNAKEIKNMKRLLGSATLLAAMLGISGCDDAQTASATYTGHQRVTYYLTPSGAYVGSISGRCSPDLRHVNSVRTDLTRAPNLDLSDHRSLKERQDLLTLLCVPWDPEPGANYVVVRD